MHKKYIARLSDEERGVCQDVVKRSQMLLKADADGPAWIDARIAEAFDRRVQTVECLRSGSSHRALNRHWSASGGRLRRRLHEAEATVPRD